HTHVTPTFYLRYSLALPHPYPPLFLYTPPPPPHPYTLSLHDALPIFPRTLHQAMELDRVIGDHGLDLAINLEVPREIEAVVADEDRKSTRLNSSHVSISYAVFCLKKKKKTTQ